MNSVNDQSQISKEKALRYKGRNYRHVEAGTVSGLTNSLAGLRVKIGKDSVTVKKEDFQERFKKALAKFSVSKGINLRRVKGTRLLRAIRDLLQEEDMHPGLEFDDKLAIESIQNISFTDAKIAMAYGSHILKSKDTRTSKEIYDGVEKSCQKSSQWIANSISGWYENSKGKWVMRKTPLYGNKHNYGCSKQWVDNFLKTYKGVLVNVESRGTVNEKGEPRKAANSVSLTTFGRKVLKLLRMMHFEKLLFPRRGKFDSVKRYTKRVERCREGFRLRKKQLGWMFASMKKSLKRLMNSVEVQYFLLMSGFWKKGQKKKYPTPEEITTLQLQYYSNSKVKRRFSDEERSKTCEMVMLKESYI